MHTYLGKMEKEWTKSWEIFPAPAMPQRVAIFPKNNLNFSSLKKRNLVVVFPTGSAMSAASSFFRLVHAQMQQVRTHVRTNVQGKNVLTDRQTDCLHQPRLFYPMHLPKDIYPMYGHS